MLLHDHFQDAWAQQLATTLGKRKDFGEMHGIDHHVISLGHRRVPSYQLGSIKCVQDGTFICTKAHARFDLTLSGTCKFCGAEDTLDHRCTQCPHLQHIYANHLPALREWATLPKQQTWHLIPPRNPWVSPFFRALDLPPSYSLPRFIPPSDDNMVNLFVDGSCRRPDCPQYSLASWAIVCSNYDTVIASGALTGGRQSSDRAELEGLIRSVEISARWNRPTTIWTDSSFAGGGLSRILQDAEDHPDASPAFEAEWIRLKEAVEAYPAKLYVQHVPGHGESQARYQDVQEWMSYWNQRADRAASAAFSHHHPELRRLWTGLFAHHDQQVDRQVRLQSLHGAVAMEYQQSQAETMVHEDALDVETAGPPDPLLGLSVRRAPHDDYWMDALPTQWLGTDGFLKLAAIYSMQFVRRTIQFLQTCRDHEEAEFFHLSWLELAALLFLEFGQQLPVPSSTVKGHWTDITASTLAGRHSSQTAAAILRLTKSFIGQLGKEFDLPLVRKQGLSLATWGVHAPQVGIAFALPNAQAVSAARVIQRFTLSRPIRTVNDLARPF